MNPHWLDNGAHTHWFPWRRCAPLGDQLPGVAACVGCRRSSCIERQNVVVQLSSLCDLPSDAHSCWPQGAGKGMEWAVSPLNNEASHGLCLSKVELHGFASNGTVLLRLNALIHPPSGDNSLFASNGAWVIRTVAVGSPSPLISLLSDADVGRMFMRGPTPEAHSLGVSCDCSW